MDSWNWVWLSEQVVCMFCVGRSAGARLMVVY